MAAAARKAFNSGVRGIQSWGSVFGNAALTPGVADIDGHPVRGIMVGTDGNYSLVFEDDTSNTAVVLPLKAGVQYGFLIRRLTVAAGSVWGGGS